jgi:hypothetical protein
MKLLSKTLRSAVAGVLALGLSGPVVFAADAPGAPKSATESVKNPCAAANPCAAKKANPPAAKKANPCAAKKANPCAAKGANPCAAKNPCAPKH